MLIATWRPGQYTISVESEGIYPNQFKTVVLRPGEIGLCPDRIAEIVVSVRRRRAAQAGGGGTRAAADTFVVQIIDPAAALSEMGDLRFIRG